jgi:hypothetical protein
MERDKRQRTDEPLAAASSGRGGDESSLRGYPAEVDQLWPANKTVKLNVGGQKYMTTTATLRREKVCNFRPI